MSYLQRQSGAGPDIREQVSIAGVQLLRQNNGRPPAQFHVHGSPPELRGFGHRDQHRLRTGEEVLANHGGGRQARRQQGEKER